MVCVRHPDRPTGLRCTRCERPACPECLHDASVGHHCVDCVKESRASRRETTTIAGARQRSRPVVTWSLVAVNAAVFLWTVVSAGSVARNYFSAPSLEGVLVPVLVADGQWWRLITSGFLHFGLIHLLLNLLALWIWGRDVEAVLGPGRFLAVYGLSLLGGSAAVMAFGAVNVPVAGASGAIYGLLGALLVLVIRLRLRLGPVLTILALNIFISFGIEGISWLGHLGGLVIGSIAMLAMVYAPRRRRTAIQLGTVIALAILLLVVVMLGVARVGG